MAVCRFDLTPYILIVLSFPKSESYVFATRQFQPIGPRVERQWPGLEFETDHQYHQSEPIWRLTDTCREGIPGSFETSRDLTYLRAAFRTATPFLVAGKDGGVLAFMFGKLSWYKKYPTVPSTFVLNGFMNSLFGLYDLAITLECLRFGGEALSDDGGYNYNEVRFKGRKFKVKKPTNEKSTDFAEAKRRLTLTTPSQLFEVGMRTLGIALPLFDTGSGSFYDLNHFTHPGVTPNLARWDHTSISS
ncbi:hypothetical protein HELRODRAFT_180923 [Helobdella robusta]|uniref:D-glucuronyl C5-epimerase C-terminal domain-containing protein n=1 Tax=Helobdella robusta TaxID=6412 RepID=T1FGF3_HELRO|nr:hypothetical protein HELRODRAFT_180923 [Helobdella robusta]ESN93394.1 hypothetical protein HELRODRAFT_180923 [Helobdella robusta]